MQLWYTNSVYAVGCWLRAGAEWMQADNMRNVHESTPRRSHVPTRLTHIPYYVPTLLARHSNVHTLPCIKYVKQDGIAPLFDSMCALVPLHFV